MGLLVSDLLPFPLRADRQGAQEGAWSVYLVACRGVQQDSPCLWRAAHGRQFQHPPAILLSERMIEQFRCGDLMRRVHEPICWGTAITVASNALCEVLAFDASAASSIPLQLSLPAHG